MQTLDPTVLTDRLLGLLPEGTKKFDSAQDVLAALLHTTMVQLGFHLIALGHDDPLNPDPENVLPKDWAQKGPDNYTFRYKHDKASVEFLLNVTKLGRCTLLNAIGSEDTCKLASLNICTEDFVPPSITTHEIDTGTVTRHELISIARMKDLLSQFELEIVSQILPGCYEKGDLGRFGDTPTVERAAEIQQTPDNLSCLDPRPEDVSQPHPQNLGTGICLIPPNVGHGDLDPDMRSPPFPMPNPAGSFMEPGYFAAPTHRDTGQGGLHGPWGGDGFLPPMRAPPRGRFGQVAPTSFFGGNRSVYSFAYGGLGSGDFRLSSDFDLEHGYQY